MASFTVKPLSEATWPDFVRMVEAHNGVWGGCRCIGFHEKGTGPAEGNRDAKLARVREGRAHAALVCDGENCIGWSQLQRRPAMLKRLVPVEKPHFLLRQQ